MSVNPMDGFIVVIVGNISSSLMTAVGGPRSSAESIAREPRSIAV